MQNNNTGTTTNDNFQFFGLGGSNEVGRSCHVIRYKGKTVMLDAGVHPAYRGMASLPFYDEIDLSTIDVLLISHFHLDHAASLPYVMQKTNFKGRVFMTHPTKAIYRWLLKDFVRVTSLSNNANSNIRTSNDDDNLYNDTDLVESFDRIETIDYHSTMDISGIKFTAYHAGHVLGAAMFQIEIAGLRILFTGDYSREVDRHLNSAEVPPFSTDVLIVESTFGTATHEPRITRERKLTSLIHNTVVKGGRVLLPVFALGRAQELLLILDEYWTQHSNDLGNGQVPIYYASNLARKCLNVFQTYINMMNDNIRKKFRDSKTNPFIFKNILYLKNIDDFQDFGPSVMLASPGMLQNGVSRDLLEKWCPEEKNLVLITGYSIEGTMAKFLMLQPDHIPSINNPDISVPRRCQVEEISFAAHVDFQENLDFIEQVGAGKIILVHGESNPMGRLKSALLSNFKNLKNTEKEVKVYNPRNCVLISLEFKGVKVAKAIGNLADEISSKLLTDEDIRKEDNDGIKTKKNENENENENERVEDEENSSQGLVVSGILVSDEKTFDLNLVSLTDIREHHVDLKTTILKERQSVTLGCKKDLIYWHLLQMFGSVDVLIDDDNVTNIKETDLRENKVNGELEIMIMKSIKLHMVDSLATLEWVQSAINDTVADSVMAILLSVESSPASVKLSSHTHDHHHDHHHEEDQILLRIQQIANVFKEQFGDTFTLLMDKEEIGGSPKEDIKGLITINESMTAKINFTTLKVEECTSKPLKGRIESILKIGSDLVTPLC
ncbi:cleavage polyadenylation factor subunit YSH1 SCDLUD_000893 [Saccharomycodes ludwigii]|uniref:cleavage polyadenylation factor subunit YSH1 n=1 Tax=Saccharomycodes ludwigii TaxID=36035 RepID=UPI001E858B33|nr:hypothetical protein SCDLUD_000893 [Saccharomycodes ludwigii]KAH3903269.1 hypothetical protein SCDLUD_000893 [Saccharomycodes ludwigii]